MEINIKVSTEEFKELFGEIKNSGLSNKIKESLLAKEDNLSNDEINRQIAQWNIPTFNADVKKPVTHDAIVIEHFIHHIVKFRELTDHKVYKEYKGFKFLGYISTSEFVDYDEFLEKIGMGEFIDKEITNKGWMLIQYEGRVLITPMSPITIPVRYSKLRELNLVSGDRECVVGLAGINFKAKLSLPLLEVDLPKSNGTNNSMTQDLFRFYLLNNLVDNLFFKSPIWLKVIDEKGMIVDFPDEDANPVALVSGSSGLTILGPTKYFPCIEVLT